MKKSLTDDVYTDMKREVSRSLSSFDLVVWSTACRSFAPIHYARESRREWFDRYQARVGAAREIVAFVARWIKQLRDGVLRNTTAAVTRDHIIKAIREEMEKQGIMIGKLNSVKLGGFKTLIKWADNKDELDKKPKKRSSVSEGAHSRGKRARRRVLGEFGPPSVELEKEYELLTEKRILLTIKVANKFMHPLQNVAVELELGPNLAVRESKPYPWSPVTQRVQIGFLAASLENSPNEAEFNLVLDVRKRRKKYLIEGKVHYDDLERGVRAEAKLRTMILKL